MGGNSIGRIFRVTTFGESHGKGVGVVIDGCPSGFALSAADFVEDMARRRPGTKAFDTPRKEGDEVDIVSGVFEGRTTGAPIMLMIRNRDANSEPYQILRKLFRPGHADFTYYKKYGHFDFAGGGRYSARETAARVAAGVVAGMLLEPLGVDVVAYTRELGGIAAKETDVGRVVKDPLYCPDPLASEEMQSALLDAREAGDSLGGVVEIRVQSCPVGLGEPVFDKLDADLAKAVMSVGAVKGVEVGAGFDAARLKGSENNDPLTPQGFASNRAGGILGGISNGDDITLRVAVKPIPSIRQEQQTIDRQGQPASVHLTGRFDVSAIPRIIPVLEAMVKIVLADHLLRQKGMETGQGLSAK